MVLLVFQSRTDLNALDHASDPLYSSTSALTAQLGLTAVAEAEAVPTPLDHHPDPSPKGFIGFPKSIINDGNNEDEDIEVIHFGVVWNHQSQRYISRPF